MTTKSTLHVRPLAASKSLDGHSLLVEDREIYRKYADLYDRIYLDTPLYQAATEFVLGRLGPNSAMRILDLCAGTGSHARLLTDAGASVLGIDRSAEMLEIARRKAPLARFLQCDVRDLSLAERFDAVTCLYGSIHYIERIGDVDRIFRTAFRHLAPGGLLIFELRDGQNVPEQPLIQNLDGLSVSTCWLRKRGVDASDLYVVSAFDPHSGRHFVDVHNLFHTDPILVASRARAVGFVDVELLWGYSDVPYRRVAWGDGVLLVGRRDDPSCYPRRARARQRHRR
jgi:SAM-dependent methyltransferase